MFRDVSRTSWGSNWPLRGYPESPWPLEGCPETDWKEIGFGIAPWPLKGKVTGPYGRV